MISYLKDEDLNADISQHSLVGIIVLFYSPQVFFPKFEVTN